MTAFLRVSELRIGDDDSRRRRTTVTTEEGDDVELRWYARCPRAYGFGLAPYGKSQYGGPRPENVVTFEVGVHMRGDAGEWVLVRRDRTPAFGYRYAAAENRADAARFGAAFRTAVRFSVAIHMAQGVGPPEWVETIPAADGEGAGVRRTCAPARLPYGVRIEPRCGEAGLDVRLPAGSQASGLRIFLGDGLLLDVRPNGRLSVGSLGLLVPLGPESGGTGLQALGDPTQVLRVSADGTRLEFADAASGGGLSNGEVLSRIFALGG